MFSTAKPRTGDSLSASTVRGWSRQLVELVIFQVLEGGHGHSEVSKILGSKTMSRDPARRSLYSQTRNAASYIIETHKLPPRSSRSKIRCGRDELQLIGDEIHGTIARGADWSLAMGKIAAVTVGYCTGLRVSSLLAIDPADPSLGGMWAEDLRSRRTSDKSSNFSLAAWTTMVQVRDLKGYNTADEQSFVDLILTPVNRAANLVVEPSVHLLSLLIGQQRLREVYYAPRRSLGIFNSCTRRQQSWKGSEGHFSWGWRVKNGLSTPSCTHSG